MENISGADELLAAVIALVNVWLLMALSLAGIATNALTIAVFRRQGWHERVNISMVVISALDLARCAMMILKRLHGFVELASPAWGASWSNLTTPSVEFVNVFTGYVTFTLLAYISVERCLCVTAPLRIKSVLTRQTTVAMLASLSLIVYGLNVIMCFLYALDTAFDPRFNTTIIIFVHSQFYQDHGDDVTGYINILSIVHPTVCFLVLCITSFVILKHLRKSHNMFSSSMLRNKNATTSLSHMNSSAEINFSRREKQVTKMLLAVIFVYIGNLVPRITLYAAQIIEPEFHVFGNLGDYFMMGVTVMLILDVLHSSVNFFIFYFMSAGFRNICNNLW